jgi:hypothetical protein
MNRTLKTIVHPAGKRRLLIVRRPDGLFSYEEQELVMVYDVELAERLQDYRSCWVPVGHDLTICDTEEAAEREGCGAVAWLAEI